MMVYCGQNGKAKIIMSKDQRDGVLGTAREQKINVYNMSKDIVHQEKFQFCVLGILSVLATLAKVCTSSGVVTECTKIVDPCSTYTAIYPKYSVLMYTDRLNEVTDCTKSEIVAFTFLMKS